MFGLKKNYLEEKIISCPKKNYEIVTLAHCKECELFQKCAAAHVTFTDMPKYLPRDFQAKAYDLFMPTQLMISVEKSDRRYLWKRVADLIHIDNSIIDLACGTGRFAKILQIAGFEGKYLGIEWAESRVKAACEYVPGYKFDLGDVFSERTYKLLKYFDIILMLEFLVQVYDIKLINELLDHISQKQKIIFTVQINHEDEKIIARKFLSRIRTDYWQKFEGLDIVLLSGKKKA